LNEKTGAANQIPRKILDEVSKAIIGKDALKEALLIALIAGGHILIEGEPGTAKSRIARAFAEAIGGTFKRIQLTPDMMPADITGFYMYNVEGNARFIAGPLLSNVVLADELNRTTPRTQSALLEAMGEGQVSIEGTTHRLPRPFLVIATQVSAGAEGTYPLTDVQIDRFLLRSLSRYPERAEERQIVSRIDFLEEPSLKPVVDSAQIFELQEAARHVHVADPVLEYMLDVAAALRHDPDISGGPSPRGAISLFKCGRARALLDGRDYVIPDDVKFLAEPVFGHRLHVKPEAEMEGINAGIIIGRALAAVAIPKV